MLYPNTGYDVREELGSGGMGRVFAAVAANGNELALKCLHPALANNAVLAQRLLDEAKLACMVKHPNVVRVIESGRADDGTPFLVMQRAPGSPLGTVIRAHGPLPLRRIRTITSQILAGLGAIHAAGLVHGDVKADNILVDDRDRVTIIDFGLARAQRTTPTWLGDDMLSGTPEYMAPEVIRGEPMTPAADLYAVGVIMYEMLTGTTPFGGGGNTAIFHRHLEDDVVPPSLRCSERTLPTAVESVVMRALAKDPARRHYSAGLFGAAVEHMVPPNWIDAPVPGACTFSTTASTRPCALLPLRPHRRLADGTRGKSLVLERMRKQIALCRSSGDSDAAIDACLGVTEVLLRDRQLRAAADGLVAARRWLDTAGSPPPRMWCLLVTLAAVHDQLHEPARAREVAIAAVAAAAAASDAKGIETASRLLSRITSRRVR